MSLQLLGLAHCGIVSAENERSSLMKWLLVKTFIEFLLAAISVWKGQKNTEEVDKRIERAKQAGKGIPPDESIDPYNRNK